MTDTTLTAQSDRQREEEKRRTENDAEKQREAKRRSRKPSVACPSREAIEAMGFSLSGELRVEIPATGPVA